MKSLLKSLLICFCLFCLGFQAFQTIENCRQSKKNTFVTKTSVTDQETTSLVNLIYSLDIPKEELTLLIDKSNYELSVLSDTAIIKSYPVVFGTNPVDDKLMQGDRSTPEGNFSVRAFYPHKSWSKFIWIDYPTADSWTKHNAAKAKDKIPENAKIGGEIGIHGVPKGYSSLISNKQNWTWGCISLTNADVNDLFPIIYKGMKIKIRK